MAGIPTHTTITVPHEADRHVTGTPQGNKQLLDVAVLKSAGSLGLHMLDGDEITVNLPNVTVLAMDQIGDDSYPIPNLVGKAGGRALLNFLTVENTIYTNGKLDLDIVFWESAPTTTSSTGTPFALSQANTSLYQGHVELRENHWAVEWGTTERVANVSPYDLGQEIKCVATSGYFSVIWRGPDLAVGASETLKFKFGSIYLD